MICILLGGMNLPDLSFDVDRNDLRVSLIGLDDVIITASKPEWNEYEKDVFDKIRKSITLEDVKDEPLFRSYRNLYWTFGMDPTKLRVSSEALLRRILKGLNLWRVSNLVDVVNLASPYHKIPIGLVDVATVEGQLQVRVAEKGEEFTRIGGQVLKCRGREIVLADDKKIVCFGYATHDSDMTKVSKTTKQAYVLLYGSPEITSSYLESSTSDTVQMITSWIDCTYAGTRFYESHS